MSKTVRVVSIPAGHPYVERATSDPSIMVLPDPPVPGAPADRWWPPVAFDPDWIGENSERADVLHIHFGIESFTLDHVARVIDAAHAAHWPIVLTVHDIDHPQLSDQSPHHAQLDLLVPAADAVVTLTQGAASVIAERWGREAIVIPHPRLLAPGAVPTAVSSREGTDSPVVVGVHLKDLRPNVDGPSSVRHLIGAVEMLATRGLPVTARVRMHRSTRDDAAAAEVHDLCDSTDAVDLVVHDRLDDQGLADELSSLDICMLPYIHGTHSGWLELCWDLGVPVLVPDVAHFAEQHADPSIREFCLADAPRSLAAAIASIVEATAADEPDPHLTRARTPGRAALATSRARLRDHDDALIARRHTEIYRTTTAAVRAAV